MKATGRTQNDVGIDASEYAKSELAPETREHDLQIIKSKQAARFVEKVPDDKGNLRIYEVFKFPVESGGRLLVGGCLGCYRKKTMRP